MTGSGGSAQRPWRVVVVGAGISGLTAAHRLAAAGAPIEVTLLDAASRPGGVLSTVRRDDCLLELGPDCFMSTKPAGLKLCEELGLAGELIGTNPSHRRSFIARGGRLCAVPDGFHLLAPSKFWPFVTTPLFSPLGKLRMGLELFLPRGAGDADESLAEFVTRRLGREALERAAQPMIGGIYTADPRMLSLKATMPQILEMERAHGSVLLGMWRARSARSREEAAGARGSGARYDLFLSFKDGMTRLVEALSRRLPAGAFRPGSHVERLAAAPGGRGWNLSVRGEADMAADAICLALPAARAAALLTEHDRELAGDLAGIAYASSGTVNLVYDRALVPHALDGMGFVVPAIERRTALACSFSSVKFAGRAPEGTVLLRAFVGGAMQPETLEMDDDRLVAAVRADLALYLGVSAPPRLVEVSRHAASMAQYHVGHLERIARIEAREARHAGLALAGNGYRGVGIPDCIASGERAASRLLGQFAAPVAASA